MLNKFSKVVLTTTALVALSTAAHADGAKMYVGGNFQYLFSNTEDTEISGVSEKYKEDAGYGFSGTVGAKFDNFRAEGELEFLTAESEDYNEDHSALALMLNGFYDVKNSSQFTPYIGGGLGIARTSFSTNNGDNSVSDTVFAYQVMTGVAYDINEHNTVSLGYRYFGTQDGKYNGNEASLGKHIAEVGYRYTF
jgi:opacity protein-like surface antigen